MKPSESSAEVPATFDAPASSRPVSGEKPPENPLGASRLHPTLRQASDRSWEKYETVYRRLGR